MAELDNEKLKTALMNRDEAIILKYCNESSLFKAFKILLVYSTETHHPENVGEFGYDTFYPNHPKNIRLSVLKWLPEIEADKNEITDLLIDSYVHVADSKELQETVLEGLVKLFEKGSGKALVHLSDMGESSIINNVYGDKYMLEFTNNYFTDQSIQNYVRDALMSIPDDEKLFVLLDSNYKKVWKHLNQATKPENKVLGKEEIKKLSERATRDLPREQIWWILPKCLYPNLKEKDYIGYNPISNTYSHNCDGLDMKWPVGITDFSRPVNAFGLVEKIEPFNKYKTLKFLQQ